MARQDSLEPATTGLAGEGSRKSPDDGAATSQPNTPATIAVTNMPSKGSRIKTDGMTRRKTIPPACGSTTVAARPRVVRMVNSAAHTNIKRKMVDSDITWP